MIQIGHTLPSAEVFSLSLEPLNLAQITQGQTTVLLFFPAAFTRVCTAELCNFRDSLTLYQDLGAQVLGLSVDTPYSLKVFAEQLGLSYPLLSDFNRQAIRALDIVHPQLRGLQEVAKRAAYVIDGQGVVRYVWVGEHLGLEPPYDEVAQAVREIQQREQP